MALREARRAARIARDSRAPAGRTATTHPSECAARPVSASVLPCHRSRGPCPLQGRTTGPSNRKVCSGPRRLEGGTPPHERPRWRRTHDRNCSRSTRCCGRRRRCRPICGRGRAVAASRRCGGRWSCRGRRSRLTLLLHAQHPVGMWPLAPRTRCPNQQQLQLAATHVFTQLCAAAPELHWPIAHRAIFLMRAGSSGAAATLPRPRAHTLAVPLRPLRARSECSRSSPPSPPLMRPLASWRPRRRAAARGASPAPPSAGR